MAFCSQLAYPSLFLAMLNSLRSHESTHMGLSPDKTLSCVTPTSTARRVT